MLIDDDRAFSVVIANKDGQPFLERTLDYLIDLEYPGHVVICDSSEGPARDAAARCQADYPDLWLDVIQYPPETRILDKLCDTLRTVESELVLLHANDDFMVPAEVNRCVEVMSADSGFSAARGRIALFGFESAKKNDGSGPAVALFDYPMRAYIEDDPVVRALDMIGRYSATFYSVHRRHLLVENFRLTENATKNVIFFQYLSSTLMAMQGRIWCGDRLFYARQTHARSMSTQMRQGDYEHWPLLITSQNFSSYYRDFRSCLCDWAQERLGVPREAFGPRIDRAAADGLLNRGFCQRETELPVEEQLFKARLHDSSTDEHRELRRMVEFALRYPGTA